MAKRTPVDEAFDRYKVLSTLIEMEARRARSNPLDPRYLDLGMVERGDTKREAGQKITETLDQLARLVEHMAILDMAGSLELAFRARIGSAIGALRSLIKSDPNQDRHGRFGIKLVKTLADFEGLNDILGLVEDDLSKHVLEAIALVRKSRNAFAHGTDLRIPRLTRGDSADANSATWRVLRRAGMACLFVCFASAHAAPLSPPDEANAEQTEQMCTLSAQEQNLEGKALDGSVQQCVAQESPTLAYWEHCRQSARHQHLKGVALRDDVSACMEREP